MGQSQAEFLADQTAAASEALAQAGTAGVAVTEDPEVYVHVHDDGSYLDDGKPVQRFTEVTGDCFAYAETQAKAGKKVAVAILTNETVINGELIMGGGQALAARNFWPELPGVLGAVLNCVDFDYNGRVLPLNGRNLSTPAPFDLLVFATKVRPDEPSSPTQIAANAEESLIIATMQQWDEVVLPRPGCGLGGLDWEADVKDVLVPILDERFTIITF